MGWEESEVEAEGASLRQCQLEQASRARARVTGEPLSSSSAQLCQAEEEVGLYNGGLEISATLCITGVHPGVFAQKDGAMWY